MKSWLAPLSVLLNVFAIVAPVYSLYARYGITERITLGSGAMGQLVSIGGAMLAGFAIALLASNLLRKTETTYTSILSTIAKSLATPTVRKNAA